jgi:formamidopyrimidine-DNA glycosylase
MPELPEVETIARELGGEVCGRRILAVDLRRPASVAAGAPALSRKAFREKVAGRIVARVWRRAKILILDLAAGEGDGDSSIPVPGRESKNREISTEVFSSITAAGVASSAATLTSAAEAPALHLAVRLGMSGRLWIAGPGAAPEKHTHVIFALDDGRKLFFTDPRTFGNVRAVPGGRLDAWPAFAALGPEPLDIGPAEFAACFAGRSGKMKALLLDQNRIAGVGNIYADESLFRAGVSPEARADTVSAPRLHRLHAALQEVLTEAIAANGSSIRDYRDAHGDAGAFQNAFRAYGRAGQPCTVCGATLAKTTVAGRTTTYCRKCQR